MTKYFEIYLQCEFLYISKMNYVENSVLDNPVSLTIEIAARLKIKYVKLHIGLLVHVHTAALCVRQQEHRRI